MLCRTDDGPGRVAHGRDGICGVDEVAVAHAHKLTKLLLLAVHVFHRRTEQVPRVCHRAVLELSVPGDSRQSSHCMRIPRRMARWPAILAREQKEHAGLYGGARAHKKTTRTTVDFTPVR